VNAVTAVGGRTRTEQVYACLRADILSGRLRPGGRLPFAELTERYRASMGVIREGLSRLAEQGLVQSEPQHGFRVTPLSVEDLGELTDARCELEALVLRLAIEHGSLAWESQIVATHHALERTNQFSDDDPALINEAWTAAHSRFHLALLDGCPNGRLLALAASLRDSAELYRQWSGTLGHREGRDVGGEHRALMEAAIARRTDVAVGLLVDHMRSTAALLMATVSARAGGH
jgi:DNA-binding GntR family transcriptional regulator